MKKMAAIATGCVLVVLGWAQLGSRSSEAPISDDVASEATFGGGISRGRSGASQGSGDSQRAAPDDTPGTKAEPKLSVRGGRDEATDALLAVWAVSETDTSETMSQGPYIPLDQFERPYMLTLNESDFFKLSPEDQTAAMEEIGDSLRGIRRQALDTFEQAEADIEGGNYAGAETALTDEFERAGEFNANKDGLYLTRVVGIALQQGALKRMETLYTRTGDHAKLQQTQRQWQDLESEKDHMRATAQQVG